MSASELSHPRGSVTDDALDTLVSKASAPSLATLFKRAKEKGLITSIPHYGPNKEAKAPPEQAPQQPYRGASQSTATNYGGLLPPAVTSNS